MSEATQPYQQRMVIERDQLFDRIERLSAFMLTPLYEKLPVEEKDRMQKQLIAMQSYQKVLDERIKAFAP